MAATYFSIAAMTASLSEKCLPLSPFFIGPLSSDKLIEALLNLLDWQLFWRWLIPYITVTSPKIHYSLYRKAIKQCLVSVNLYKRRWISMITIFSAWRSVIHVNYCSAALCKEAQKFGVIEKSFNTYCHTTNTLLGRPRLYFRRDRRTRTEYRFLLIASENASPMLITM